MRNKLIVSNAVTLFLFCFVFSPGRGDAVSFSVAILQIKNDGWSILINYIKL